MGQSDFSIACGLLCKLSRLVLAAQTLQCITAGSVFLSHADFWGSARRGPAGRAAGDQFHYWRGLCHRRNYPGERLRMAEASNHAKMMRSIAPELLHQTKLPIQIGLHRLRSDGGTLIGTPIAINWRRQ